MTAALRPLGLPKATKPPVEREKWVTYGAAGVGLGAIGVGVYLIMKKARAAGGIQKEPGDPIGATIYLQRRGVGQTPQAWVGFALSPHRNQDDIVKWYGKYVDVSAEPTGDWVSLAPVDIDVGASPTELPEREKTYYECLAFVGEGEAVGEYDSKWYDNVYNFGREEEEPPWWDPRRWLPF